jgi:polyisoprenoid-binding protein YceI
VPQKSDAFPYAKFSRKRFERVSHRTVAGDFNLKGETSPLQFSSRSQQSVPSLQTEQ